MVFEESEKEELEGGDGEKAKDWFENEMERQIYEYRGYQITADDFDRLREASLADVLAPGQVKTAFVKDLIAE